MPGSCRNVNTVLELLHYGRARLGPRLKSRLTLGDRPMDEKILLPTGAWLPISADVASDALARLSGEARMAVLDGVRAKIKQLKTSRLAPPLDAAVSIRAYEEMARRIEASFPSPPRRPWRRRVWASEACAERRCEISPEGGGAA
jgi:hypothetical protein